jgi:hypothetical protein
MVRRDEFIAKLAEFNDTKGVDEALIGLEKYVDEQLLTETNIIGMINSVDAGSDFSAGSTIEVVNELKLSNDIHRDINVVGGEEKADVYYVWDEELTDKSGNSSTEKPWEDRTVLETTFVPEIRIELPENTNKNVAYKLVQKYLGVEEFDDNGIPTVGYWGLIVKPNDPETNEPESTTSDDMVRLEYDRDTGILTMVFKIY